MTDDRRERGHRDLPPSSYDENGRGDDAKEIPSINESTDAGPFSFLTEIPEFGKLLAASLFVAFVIHKFILGGSKGGSGNKTRGVAGRVKNNVLGSDATIHSSGMTLGQQAPLNRNYDKLMAKEKLLSESVSQIDNVDCNTHDEKNDQNKQILALDASITSNTYTASKAKKSALDKKANKNGRTAANRNYEKLIPKNEPNIKDGNEMNAGKKEKRTRGDSVTNDSSSAECPTDPLVPPPIRLHSQMTHPGLTGYYNWQDTITSLYRIYSIPYHSSTPNSSHPSLTSNLPSAIVSTNVDNQTTFHPAILPMQPSSERGQTPVYIEVTNRTSHEIIHVYWIDYKGNEVFKGSIRNGGGIWTQTTYIGHPWTFRIGNGDGPSARNSGEETVLLKYVPFRIIPTVIGAETSSVEALNGPVVGRQRFALKDVPEGHVTRENGIPMCFVEDSILPEPPLMMTSSNINPWASTTPMLSSEMTIAIQWSCHQIQREDAANPVRGTSSAKLLLKYLNNICLHPDNPKYRKLRTGNRIFMETIYNTGARGVLLALGFEEHFGYLEMGPGEGTLGYDRIRDVSDAMMKVDQTLKIMQDGVDGDGHHADAQPEGADGYGRAGFGYAGSMNN